MLKFLKDKKNRQTIFICQISEDALKIIKCFLGSGSKREFAGFEYQEIPFQEGDNKLAEMLASAFRKLGFNRNNVILSLPRSLAATRYIRIPSQSPQEIERIVSLQASRHLPYPAEELITGYQVVSTDKEGFSGVNIVIIHKGIAERYIKLFHLLKPAAINIFLSSYGLCNFYNHSDAANSGAAILVDIDYNSAELAVVLNKKLVFSRCFKLNRCEPGWEGLFIEEINKTCDAYIKEVPGLAPERIFVLGETKQSKEAIDALKNKTAYYAQVLAYKEEINTPADHSFISLIGLGLEATEDSLNLLPFELKEKVKRAAKFKERLKIILLLSVIIVIWILAIMKNLDNKASYIKLLEHELTKISKEAKPLEEAERVLQVIERQRTKDSAILDMLYGLHSIIPGELSLYGFSYEEDDEIIIRGKAQSLNSVFAFMEKLEYSAAFQKWRLKVKYATKKKIQNTEIVDFEIAGMKK